MFMFCRFGNDSLQGEGSVNHTDRAPLSAQRQLQSGALRGGGTVQRHRHQQGSFRSVPVA